jgi:hypothetical protein
MRNIGRMRIQSVIQVFHDQVPCPQGADEDHIVFVLGRKPDIVRKRRRDV